jgi:hypothetical protein
LRKLPNQALLHELFSYDHATGIFRWKNDTRGGKRKAGDIAGTKRRLGYIYIGVKGLGQFAAHRLAWIYIHGIQIGGAEIDHKDNDPSNNAIDNLRIATSSEQKQNRGAQSNNRAGLKGAFYHACRKGMKWRSQIKINENGNKRLIFLGYFHTAEEAHSAYVRAAHEHFGEFARVA